MCVGEVGRSTRTTAADGHLSAERLRRPVMCSLIMVRIK